MLYKFKSKITGDIIMLQPNGRRVLEIIGKDTQPGSGDRGIILPDQMPGAIAALQAAVVKEEADQKAAVAEALARNEAPPRFEPISLRQRTLPFIDMLRRCEQAGQPVVLGRIGKFAGGGSIHPGTGGLHHRCPLPDFGIDQCGKFCRCIAAGNRALRQHLLLDHR